MKKTPLKNKKRTTLRTRSNLKRKSAPAKKTGLKRKAPVRKDGLPNRFTTYRTKTGKVKKRENPWWKAVRKTDGLFSLLVRLRAADEYGMVKCFTCCYRGPWKYGDIECGHFRPRGNMNTRWDFDNNRPQCAHGGEDGNCNRTLSGNIEVYRKNLIKDIGLKAVKALEKRADETKKWSLLEMKELRRIFAKEIKELRKQKGL